jgi:drug/metabolite transporter (DMT)-like permease
VPVLRVLLVSQAIGLTGLLVLVIARGKGSPALAHLLPAAGAGLGGIVALGAFYRGLAIGTMSIVAPISAIGVAIPVIVGIAGGDRPAALQLTGILAAAIGVVLASREAGSGPADAARTRASVLLALVAALGFGSFFVGLRVSARYDVLWALVASRGAGVAALALAATWRRPGLPSPRGLVPLTLIGFLDLSANGLYALATRHGLLSVVSVAASLYPVATVVLARALLGERVRRIQELGIAASLAGVVMIAAG